MTVVREAVTLPLVFLGVVWLGGLRLGAAVAYAAPSLFSLVLASLMLGVFGQAAWNSLGKDGLLFGGGADLLIANAKATLVGCLYSAIVTFVILKVLEKTIGLRVSEEEESDGCDQHLHGETAYAENRSGHIEEAIASPA